MVALSESDYLVVFVQDIVAGDWNYIVKEKLDRISEEVKTKVLNSCANTRNASTHVRQNDGRYLVSSARYEHLKRGRTPRG